MALELLRRSSALQMRRRAFRLLIPAASRLVRFLLRDALSRSCRASITRASERSRSPLSSRSTGCQRKAKAFLFLFFALTMQQPRRSHGHHDSVFKVAVLSALLQTSCCSFHPDSPHPTDTPPAVLVELEKDL